MRSSLCVEQERLCPSGSRSRRFAVVCFALVAAACLAHFVWSAWILVAEPHALNYTEGISLLSGLRVLDGEPMYPPVDAPPYVYLAYPPVYPVVSAALTGLFGGDLVGLRLFTGACEALAALLMVLLLRQRGRSWRVAALTAVGALGVLSTHKFHMLARLDMLVVLEILAALYLLVCWYEHGRPRHLVALGALWIVACLTKPTAAIPFAVMGVDALTRAVRGQPRGKAAFITGVAAASIYALVVLGLQVATSGEFLLHTITYQGESGLRSSAFARGPFVRLFETSGLLLIVPLLVFLTSRRLTLLWWLCLVSLAWLGVSSMKAGADLNYTLEPLLLLILFAGDRLGDAEGPSLWILPAHIGAARLLDWLGPLLVVLMLVLVGTSMTGGRSTAYLAPILEAGPTSMRDRAALFVAASDGLTLAEEPYFAARAGKPYWLSDPFHFGILYRHGHVRYGEIHRAMRRGRIRRVVAGTRLLTAPGIMNLLNRHYRLMDTGVAMDEDTALTLWAWAR